MIILSILRVINSLTIIGKLNSEEKHALQGHTLIDGDGDDILIKDSNLEYKTSKKDLTKTIEYIGAKTDADMAKLIQVAKNSEAESDMDRLLAGKRTFFIIFTDNFDANAVKLLEELRTNNTPYIINNNPSDAKAHNVDFPGMYAYNTLENITYTSNNMSYGLVMVPILEILSNDSMKHIDSLEIQAFYIFYTDEQLQRIKLGLYDTAKTYRTEYKFALIKYQDTTDLSHFSLTKVDLPALVGMSADKKKYRLVNVDSDNFKQFIHDFKAGKIQPHVRSEDNDEVKNGVQYIVGKNHDEHVKKASMDILMVYGSDGCPHCQNLLPALKELTEQQSSNSKVVVSYINMGKNDVNVDISGFPTITLWTDGVMVKHEGGRSVNALLKFIKENGKYNKELVISDKEDVNLDDFDLDKLQAELANKIAEMKDKTGGDAKAVEKPETAGDVKADVKEDL